MTRRRKEYAMSRRSRRLIIAAVAILASAAVWVDRNHGIINPRQSQQSSTRRDAADLSKYDGRIFSVAKVIDGDTLDIDIPDANYPTTRIRLWGVDSPESANPRTGPMYFGPEAAAFARELLEGKKVSVYLDPGNNTRGKYGRLLAYVKLPDGRFFNEVLLEEGYAYADIRFRHSHRSKYRRLEATARSAGKGLWKSVERSQLPEWLQRMNPKLLAND